MSRTVTVSSPAMPDLYGRPALEFLSMNGHESLADLFYYSLTLRTPDSISITDYMAANVPIKTLVGKEMTVRIELDGMGEFIPGLVGDEGMANVGQGYREISGLVTRARFLRSEDRRGVYEVVLEPWLTLATRTSDYKIFQGKTVLQILDEVLGDYNYLVDLRTSHSYPVRSYQVQYGETDFQFLSRLMEEWGIYYFFEHSDGRHRLVLVDDVGAHRPFTSEAYHTLRYYPPGHKIDAEYVHHFVHDEVLRSGQWVTSDYDFKKPRADLKKTVSMPRNTGHRDLEIYQWPGDYIEGEEGYTLARIRMEATGAPGFRARGEGNLRGVVTGCTFTLKGYPQDEANIDYLVLGTTLNLSDNGHASGEGRFMVECGFTVQPANNIFRAPQRQPKPRTTGPQTAIVTGPKGYEIWTDPYGRVKVSFHWNRYCTKDENSSCWIRVSYPWAGQGFGAIHVPRIGQEVIVDFENGDPDRPIITGRVYNGNNLPPWELPANATQSGILTRSTQEGSKETANALRFEDRMGHEEVWLHAEKDQRIEVEHDESHWVGHDRSKTIDHDETSHIKNDRTETVDGHERIAVHKTRSEEVDGDETLIVHSDRTRTVDGNEKESIGRNKLETIALAHMQNIGLGKMVNIGLGYNVNVGGAYAVNVGGGSNTLVGGSQSTSAGKKVRFNAGEEFEIVVGKSQFLMRADGSVLLNGVRLDVDFSGPVQVSGNDVDLN